MATYDFSCVQLTGYKYRADQGETSVDYELRDIFKLEKIYIYLQIQK